MKVLHVIPSISPARGGPSEVVRAMARSLAARGVEVHVATTDDNGPERLTPRDTILVGEGNVTYRIFKRQARFYTFSFPLVRWLWKNSMEYDVIHIHALFSFPSVAAAFCASRAAVPYIVRPLGTLNQWGMHRRRPWLKKLSFRFIESRILRRAAAVHYTSEQEVIEARRLGVEHRSLVIPNPVELPQQTPARGAFRAKHPGLANRIVILFLSRLDPKKGIDLLLPAFSYVRTRHARAVLVLAGGGEPSFVNTLRRQAADLGLDGSVLWTGFLEGQEKREALADADLFVLPSYSENFGIAVVEAMGTGVSVIVSDQVGIHREISAAQAGSVVKCDVKSLASALMQAIGDPQWRAEASANAAKLARRFAPEMIAGQLTDLYQKILTKDGHSVAA